MVRKISKPILAVIIISSYNIQIVLGKCYAWKFL